ncbi:pancreatic triacylglycerol lipase-like isoform X2 [Portunus trituberculatus]|uniref:pancreatic triacylglycerol lipase-like isoform X2 n=1 Tax=Portunus trituberculatus TaxID=210409 RepID=UPI001E1D02A1|nr:pancreatic triacylglycerol lipase-like isoform X2 [Portunus trituberculatus]
MFSSLNSLLLFFCFAGNGLEISQNVWCWIAGTRWGTRLAGFCGGSGGMVSPWRVATVAAVVVLMAVTAAAAVEESGVVEAPSFLSGMMSGLSTLPVIGNVLRASVHPLYQPLVSPLQPAPITREDAAGEDGERCFGELGCLSLPDTFFHPVHRPINLPPYRREQVGVTFTVHTREDPRGTPVPALQVEAVLNTSFTPQRPTKFIIHGFLDHTGVTWMLDMVRALLTALDLNVVTVDWSGGSQALYSQATTNTRLVGLEVAHFIHFLKNKFGLDPRDVHIIGHSLGSHTAGYAGERVAGLGRITGLDPAEPFFQFMPPSVRLDPSDALFVDVIHSDADSIFNLGAGFGLRQPVGHLDFYPNDGRGQPGCDSLARVPLTALTDGVNLLEGLDAAQKEFIACHHNRAAKLFTDSILSPCPYTAFQCTSYTHYLKGECVNCGQDGKRCARLGLYADRWLGDNLTQVEMYLSTGPGPHYCLYHYLLTVEVADPEGIGGSAHGRLRVSLITEDGEIKDFDLSKERPLALKRGQSYSFFLEHPRDLSFATEALVHWTYEADIFNPLSYCVIFCDTSLAITRLTLASVDVRARDKERREKASEAMTKTNQDQDQDQVVVMCHKQGRAVVRVQSEAMVKVVASPNCPNASTTSSHTLPAEAAVSVTRNLTMELVNAGLESLSSVISAIT